jgi:MoaA/NifB/PqqE/SkfB family radical SAM enzyme
MRTEANSYLTGLAFRMYRLRSIWSLWQEARLVYPSLSDAWDAFRGVLQSAWRNRRYRYIAKGLRWQDRIYTLVGLPGYPSPAWYKLVRNELHRVKAIPGHPGHLSVVIFAFTKKCPLRCEHCVESDVLNKHETLSLEDMKAIVRKFQDYGVVQIELSGGEPLNRFSDMLELLRGSDTEKTDFWVLSSGYHFTEDKARQLREAGLVGVSISLDHWERAAHDRFRGVEGSYDWALKAVQHARDAGLLVSLSLVPTRDFCTPDHLMGYADLAKHSGAHFIHILEPKAAGRYAGLDVELKESHLTVLDNFVQMLQSDPAYRDYPPVEYHAAYQRKVGCGGAGRRYLYVDTDGDVHVCPFCRHKWGSALREDVSSLIDRLSHAGGCPFAAAT